MSSDPEALLATSGWARKLARRLVFDADVADDLVQDAWVAALRHPPPDDRPLRRWLAAVLRNLARARSRGESRRVARERDAARIEPDSSAEDALDRLAMHELLVAAVRSLDEPYRSAIVMRYLEELSPREIARRTGTPVRTVHVRLSRGLAKLRARLDRDRGRKAWCLALAPLAWRPGEPALLGALLMDAKIKVAAAGVALAGLCAVTALVLSDSAPLEPPPVAATSAPAALEAADETATSLAEPEPERAREALAAPLAPAESAPAVAAAESPGISARVLDVDARPVIGARVVLRRFDGRADCEAVSGPDGSVELVCEGPAGRLEVDDPRWATVFQPMFWGNTRAETVVIVVAPRLPLGGIVVDAARRPIEGATVSVVLNDTLRARIPHVLDASSAKEPEVLTDAAGRFALDVPAAPLTVLKASHPRYAMVILDPPPEPTSDLEIVLGDVEAETRLLSGAVVGPRGEPIEGAWVGLDERTQRTGKDGRFTLRLEEPGESGVLWALSKGRRPARIDRLGDSNLDARAFPDPLVIVIDGDALSIEGRVLAADGRPAEGIEVGLVDATRLGLVPVGGIDDDILFPADVEALVLGTPYGYGHRTTDADGRFALEGLAARAYEIEATDGRRLVQVRVPAVMAGARGVEIPLPAVELVPRVAGRVVHPDGTSAVRVRVLLAAEEVTADGETRSVEGGETSTDEEGRFELRDVSSRVTHVYVDGEAPGIHAHESVAGKDLEQLEIVLPRPCHVQVVLDDPADGDEFEVLDERGEPLNVIFHHGNVAWNVERAHLVEGRSEAVIVSELGRTVVLYADGAEVWRKAVELVPGEVVVVRP